MDEMTCPTCQGQAFKREEFKTGDITYDIFLCRICGKKITKARAMKI
ncbi:MAG: hypothetical protein ABIH34_00700 [Nanoarchaeota archaeon]